MGKLDGKVVFVTGGARGQGRSHAVLFAEEGADIVIFDIAADIDSLDYALARPDDLEQTSKLVQDRGRRCLTVVGDVRDTGQVSSAVDQAIAEFGQIDVLLANAG